MNSKWPASLTIIRHGQSERNVAKAAALAAGMKASYVDAVRDQDTPLTPLGIMQANFVGQHLAFERQAIDTVFFSPYLRTRQTTEMMVSVLKNMGRQVGPKLVMEERVREIEFGILDGLTPDGIRAKYPEEVARRSKEGKYWYRPPGGESRPDVCLRIHSFLDTLTRDYSGQYVVVVCHSVVVLCFRRLLERWDEQEYMRVDKEDDVKNCSITRYEPDQHGKIQLVEYNRITYPEQV